MSRLPVSPVTSNAGGLKYKEQGCVSGRLAQTLAKGGPSNDYYSGACSSGRVGVLGHRGLCHLAVGPRPEETLREVSGAEATSQGSRRPAGARVRQLGGDRHQVLLAGQWSDAYVQ